MAKVGIFWDPQGRELDSLRSKRYLGHTDGDTPRISVNIRLLSVDTPEVHYPGNTDPARHDERFAQLAAWIQAGEAPVPDDLAAHLYPRLAEGRAGTRQKQQGEAAKDYFGELVETRLKRPSGRYRALFVRSADEPFDRYGRLLAYVAPNYSAAERAGLGRAGRATFNLLLVEAGWAATLVIYPSLPRDSDLQMLHEAARHAIEARRGAWADPLVLTAYEFRACYRLWQITRRLRAGERLDGAERRGYISRYCANLVTREVYPPPGYLAVPPESRLFIWPQDVGEAAGRLNLVPGG